MEPPAAETQQKSFYCKRKAATPSTSCTAQAAEKQLNAEIITREVKIAESTSVKLTSCKSHRAMGRWDLLYRSRAAAWASRGKPFMKNVHVTARTQITSTQLGLKREEEICDGTSHSCISTITACTSHTLTTKHAEKQRQAVKMWVLSHVKQQIEPLHPSGALQDRDYSWRREAGPNGSFPGDTFEAQCTAKPKAPFLLV